jgi:hypothetical protein
MAQEGGDGSATEVADLGAHRAREVRGEVDVRQGEERVTCGKVTSSAARIRPDASSRTSASWSTSAPRAVLMRVAPSGRAARTAADTIPRVVGISGA